MAIRLLIALAVHVSIVSSSQSKPPACDAPAIAFELAIKVEGCRKVRSSTNIPATTLPARSILLRPRAAPRVLYAVPVFRYSNGRSSRGSC